MLTILCRLAFPRLINALVSIKGTAQHALEMFRRTLPNGPLAVASIDSPTDSAKSFTKRANSQHPKNGVTLGIASDSGGGELRTSLKS